MCGIFAVRLMIHKPEIPHEVVKLLFLFLEWSAVVVLAVVVSEAIENGNVREVLGEDLLDRDMSFLELFVELCSFLCALILWVCR